MLPRVPVSPETQNAASLIFDQLDADGDGTVSREEFDRAMNNMYRQQGKPLSWQGGQSLQPRSYVAKASSGVLPPTSMAPPITSISTKPSATFHSIESLGFTCPTCSARGLPTLEEAARHCNTAWNTSVSRPPKSDNVLTAAAPLHGELRPVFGSMPVVTYVAQSGHLPVQPQHFEQEDPLISIVEARLLEIGQKFDDWSNALRLLQERSNTHSAELEELSSRTALGIEFESRCAAVLEEMAQRVDEIERRLHESDLRALSLPPRDAKIQATIDKHSNRFADVDVLFAKIEEFSQRFALVDLLAAKLDLLSQRFGDVENLYAKVDEVSQRCDDADKLHAMHAGLSGKFADVDELYALLTNLRQDHDIIGATHADLVGRFGEHAEQTEASHQNARSILKLHEQKHEETANILGDVRKEIDNMKNDMQRALILSAQDQRRQANTQLRDDLPVDELRDPIEKLVVTPLAENVVVPLGEGVYSVWGNLPSLKDIFVGVDPDSTMDMQGLADGGLPAKVPEVSLNPLGEKALANGGLWPPEVKCPAGHAMKNFGTSSGMGSKCDGIFTPGGCRGVVDFKLPSNIKRIRCDLCDFDLCEECFRIRQEALLFPVVAFKVTILKAVGLKYLNVHGNGVCCQCEVLQNQSVAKRFSWRTKATPKIQDPEWNETQQMAWEMGDSLNFLVYDQGMMGFKIIGRVTMPPGSFYPVGFEGHLALPEIPGAELTVRIAPVT